MGNMVIMGLLLILILFLSILYFISSRKQTHQDLKEKPNQILETKPVSNADVSEKTEKDFSKKMLEKPEKSSFPKTESKERNNNNQIKEQAEQHEVGLVLKALELYELNELENKETVKVEDIIQLTTNEKILWTGGCNESKNIETWATVYQKGLLALYRDMRRKKYQLIFFDDRKGFIQPYAKITELRQAIAYQIEKRKKRIEHIPTTGFLVRTNTFKCIKNHGVEDIIAVFTVLNKNGRIVLVETPAGYCPKCGVFYIHDYTYQRLLTYGQPLCTVISEKHYTSGIYLKMNTGMAQQSLLKMCGYTVSATEGLSDDERRKILDSIISNGIMSKFDVITYLNYFITIRKNDTKDMTEAIRKWKSDIRYVEGLNVGAMKRYSVDKVYRIEK